MKNSLKCRTAKFLITCAITILLSIYAPTSEAQTDQYERLENGFGAPWYLHDASKVEINSLKSRWQQIDEELKSTTDGFAGTYRDGGEMQAGVLRWAPNSGFVYVYVYEWFSVLDFSYGKVAVTSSGVVFTIEREQHSKNFDGKPRVTPQRWVPAKWGQSRYLIPTHQIGDFGNYVAGFSKFNDFNGPCCEFIPFLVAVAEGGWKEKFERPQVPKEYEQFIKRPVEATVRYVGRKWVVSDYKSEGKLYGRVHLKASLTPVRIDAGKRDGVKRRMLFRLINSPYGQYLKITRVSLSSSEGVVVRDVDDNGKETYYDFESGTEVEKPYPLVTVGTKVTTSPH